MEKREERKAIEQRKTHRKGTGRGQAPGDQVSPLNPGALLFQLREATIFPSGTTMSSPRQRLPPSHRRWLAPEHTLSTARPAAPTFLSHYLILLLVPALHFPCLSAHRERPTKTNALPIPSYDPREGHGTKEKNRVKGK